MKNSQWWLCARAMVVAGAAFLAAGPAPGAGIDPSGRWLSDTGESAFQVSLCGEASQLCAKVVWLRADAATPENRKYLGSFLVDHARRVGANKWRGSVNYLGQSLAGTITLTSPRHIRLTGCLFIFCKSFGLTRSKAE